MATLAELEARVKKLEDAAKQHVVHINTIDGGDLMRFRQQQDAMRAASFAGSRAGL